MNGSRADAALPPDAPPPEPGCLDEVFAFVPSNIDRCDIPAAEDALQVLEGGFTIIDTTNVQISVNELPADPLAATLVLSQPSGGPEVLVAAFTDIDIAGRLQVLGSRPLLLVSLGDVRIRGEMLANATGNIAGPGADHALCGAGEAGQAQTSASASGARAGSGGGGGSFAEPGGQGPEVVGSSAQPSASGTVHGSASLIPLTAGCSGGAGGDVGGGEAGGGGGGVQIVAAGRFELTGTLSVSGGGGRGATMLSSGGGGGGSGGAILVEAQRILVNENGAITANGGGGGEGARGGGFGANGADGDQRGATPAAGGSGLAVSGGDGGNGGALDVPATSGSQGLADFTRAGGSGGGGGGVGRITLRAVEPMDLSGATISPSPSTPQ